MGNTKVLGVLGGMGPMATAYFMETVIRMTDASADQQHLEMLVYSCPQIPDRTGYILGKSRENPVPELIRLGRKLAEQGAERIAIPCVTSHCFYRELTEGISVPIINVLTETADCLRQHGVTKAGILATDGTLATGIFRDMLLSRGICPVVPSDTCQAAVMHMIYDDIKANRLPTRETFDRVSENLTDRGAQILILGCTELSLLKREFKLGPGYLDVLEVLAQRSVLACGGVLKPEFSDLICK